MATPVRIKIGASVDASMERAFATFEKRAQKAATAAQKALSGAGRGMLKDVDAAARAQEKGQERVAKSGKKAASEWVKSLRMIGKVAEQEMNRQARAQQRAAVQQQREARRFAERTSHRTTRFLWPNAPLGAMAGRMGRDIASGLGVDTNFGSGISRSVSRQRLLTQATNQAQMAGQNIDQGAVDERIKSISTKHGIGREGLVEGLLEFQKRTGELQLGVDMLEKLSERAVATGSDFQEMAGLASELHNSLKESGSDASVLDVLDLLTGQGLKGAVEISDFSRQGARVVAGASRFEGDRGKNVGTLGALSQLSRQTGGASNAAQAMTTVERMVDQFSTNARAAEFKNAGVNIFSDKEAGKLRDPVEIIKDALDATGGDPLKMGKMFMSSIGKKPVQALSQTYMSAGGGEAGRAAIDKQIAELMEGASVSQDAITKALERQLDTTASKTQIFQNKLDDVTESFAAKLLPALEKAGPDLLKFAETLGNTATWVVENPKKAIAAAIGVSVARAGLESALRAGIEGAILRGATGATAVPTGGAIAGLSKGLTIGALAVTTLTVGTMVIDALADAVGKGDAAAGISTAQRGATIANTEARKQKGFLSTDEARELNNQRANLATRIAQLETRGTGVTGALEDVGGLIFGGKTVKGISQERAEKGNLDEMRADLRKLDSTMASIKSGELSVRVVNMPKDVPSGREPQ